MLIVLVLGFSTFAIFLLAYRTVLLLNRFRYRAVKQASAVNALPSVSVCIAARNETHALAQCLERVLRSDYQKLEILVLDDRSDDDTSLIIKSFAQAGVRFVAGSTLPDGWLGKNHAYQTLIDESSGEYVLFLDVDTVISTTSVSQLVSQLISKNRSMVSVLPRREDGYRASALFGTMRYYWELLLSTKSKPPAASAIWMVNRNVLAETGVGLINYGMSVRPERHLAGQLQRKEQYLYLLGSRELGVSYEKHLHSQYETALRLYYPMSGRSALSWLIMTVLMSLLIAPIFILFAASDFALGLWAAGLVTLTGLTFGLFVLACYGSIAWPIRIVLGPLLLLQELVLLAMSHVLYRLGRITWKGRSVSAQPVKHDALRLDE